MVNARARFSVVGENRCRDMPFSSYQADLSGAVIGAAVEVHRVLGPGFLESIYEEAMALELALRQVPFERQVPINVSYKTALVGEGRLDLLVSDSLIVELKAVERLLPIHQAQLMSYLKAARRPVGLLINFHERLLKNGLRRIAL